MSLKDNFYQAVKELLHTGGLVGSDLEEKAKNSSELDAYLDAPSPGAAAGAEVPAYQQRQAQGHGAGTQTAQRFAQAAVAEDEPRRPRQQDVPPPQEYAPMSAFDAPTYEPPSEMTVISKNTVVDGNIHSFANITIHGNVKGNVQITRDAFLSGKMIGELKCSNVEMQGSSLQGNIVTKGRALLDGDSLLLGDLNAQYADVNGKVKGNLDISGKTEFRADAVIVGDVQTSAITVMDGANIQGFINTTFLRENGDKVFPGKVSLGEDEAKERTATQ